MTLYQTIRKPKFSISKQLGPTGITADVILCLLLDQETPHGLGNAKEMDYKMNFHHKKDLDTTYFQIHVNATTALTCISVLD